LEAENPASDNAFATLVAHFSSDSIRYIKQTAQRLRDNFNSDVPKTVDDLCSLPGVGPKMAFLALQVAWNL
jgi:Predicted EndoIII-related endonuclease